MEQQTGAAVHTPGPFAFVESGDGGGTIKDEHGGYVATVQWKGNGPMLAAAPQMLEALREVVNTQDGYSYYRAHKALNRARAAIVAATGRGEQPMTRRRPKPDYTIDGSNKGGWFFRCDGCLHRGGPFPTFAALTTAGDTHECDPADVISREEEENSR